MTEIPASLDDLDADDPLPGEPWTELGYARRLIHVYGGRLRYVPAWRRWLVWDGRRWAHADTGPARPGPSSPGSSSAYSPTPRCAATSPGSPGMPWRAASSATSCRSTTAPGPTGSPPTSTRYWPRSATTPTPPTPSC